MRWLGLMFAFLSLAAATGVAFVEPEGWGIRTAHATIWALMALLAFSEGVQREEWKR